MTGISTNLIHGADDLVRVPDVIPPINISTTFRFDEDPDKLVKLADRESDEILGVPMYSRLSHPNSEQAEQSISKVTGGYVVAYSSGLAAFNAALTYYNPKVLSIGKAYIGCHGVANILTRNHGLKQIGLNDDFSILNKGDVVHLETPVNPHGTNLNIKFYADKAHERGAYLIVDSTFAPPPLQDPFEFGADMVMHSATKYFGGHSDLLAGILVTKDIKVRDALVQDRVFLGSNIANLESSLLIRSLKTYELRILKQSENATKLVRYLIDNKAKFPNLVGVIHGSLQEDDYIKKQSPGGHSPVFCIVMSDEKYAKALPSKLKYFHHATSIGGVESLIEWKALHDSSAEPTLLRVSVGVENIEDLIEDFAQALNA